MGTLARYSRKPTATIVAVRLNLKTEGFTYEKWGGTQRCKAGDWLVTNGDDTYTVDAETFAQTYKHVRDGVYRKEGSVWAERAESDGTIQTKEGSTDYKAGDMLVYNGANRTDGYAMSRDKFESLYEAE